MALAAVLTACAGGPIGVGGAGELEVVIVGIPIGTEADVQVTGPGGFSMLLDASQALTGLAPGEYNVFALQAGPYAATQTAQNVTVPEAGRVSVDVVYVDIVSQDHECLPYAPTRAGESTETAWVSPTTNGIHTMQAPADPGGGWIEVDLTTDAPVEPWLRIRHALASGYYISSESASGSSEPHARKHVFEAAPSEPYEFRVSEDVAAPVAQHPWPYEISWTYHGRMDCYEPNESMMGSKRIPVERTIQAYAFVGHTDNSPSAAGEDWYKFDLDGAQGVVLELEMNPANVDMFVQLFNESGERMRQVASTPGGLFSEDLGTLSGTTWYLRFRPITYDRDANLYDGESIPAHFDTPYQFRLQVY